MKKACLFLAFSLLIFLLNFNTSFAGYYPEPGFAKSDLAAAKNLTQEVAASDSADKVNYELPYPGLLPDNPLYLLRVIRDKIVGFLISDPLKKAEFNLLQADKRLNAGVYLFKKNKNSLALSTISKAENYFEKALHKTEKAREEGMDIQEITRKLSDSVKKHQEVLESLKEKAPQNFKSSFNLQLQRVGKFAEEAIALASK